MKSRYGMEIRAASGADAQGVADLLATAGRPIPPRLLADRLDAIRRESGAALIAVEWGPPSGLILLHWYRSLLTDQPTAQVTALFVAPDDRRRGIGRALLKAGAQAARVAGCGTLELATALDDPTLPAFCRATGFNEAGARFERALRKGAERHLWKSDAL